MKPLGGTEIQYGFLEKYVSKELLDQFQICTSVPGKVPLAKNKINILWQKMAPDQPHFQEFFKDPEQIKQYDYYVFNSHWNYEQFRKTFSIPHQKCTVIKNGIPEFKKRDPEPLRQKIKLIYHPTPWRGLSILLGAMQLIKNPNITLDVYSSTQIYGDDFKKENDKGYEALYDQAEKLPNVNYIGYKSHDYILENLHTYDAFVYPNIWEETFCISALEALACGLYVATTDNGALYETCSEFPIYVPMDEDFKNLAHQFAAIIEGIPSQLNEKGCHNHLKFQQNFYNHFYNWKTIASHWNGFLQGALFNARPK
jgi:glycosyltransferase involved in cell wall biosynthesis|tara:strand:+ start:10107 stop:11042 length:936 start_codon:yes stop_codon:yes gene_type:complete